MTSIAKRPRARVALSISAYHDVQSSSLAVIAPSSSKRKVSPYLSFTSAEDELLVDENDEVDELQCDSELAPRLCVDVTEYPGIDPFPRLALANEQHRWFHGAVKAMHPLNSEF